MATALCITHVYASKGSDSVADESMLLATCPAGHRAREKMFFLLLCCKYALCV